MWTLDYPITGEVSKKHPEPYLTPAQRHYCKVFIEQHCQKNHFELKPEEAEILILKAIEIGPTSSLKNMALAESLTTVYAYITDTDATEDMRWILWAHLVAIDPIRNGVTHESLARLHRRCSIMVKEIQPRLSSLKTAALRFPKEQYTKMKLRRFERKCQEVISFLADNNFYIDVEEIEDLTPSRHTIDIIKCLAKFPMLSDDESLPFILLPGGEYLYMLWLAALLQPIMYRLVGSHTQFLFSSKSLRQRSVMFPHLYFL